MEVRRKDFFPAFVSISKAVTSSHSLKQVLDLIVEHGVDFLDMKAGAISLWNKKENRLELVAHHNLSQEFINKGPILVEKSISEAFTKKRPIVVQNTLKDRRLQYPEACKKEGIESILSVPVVFKDNIIGMLRLYGSKPRKFTNKEVEFITALAEQGGIAIENARYMEKVMEDHKKELDDLWDWFDAMSGRVPTLDG